MESSGLAQSWRDIALALPYYLENLYAFLQDALTMVIIPLATIMGAVVVSWKISNAILRIVSPPKAAELHREALGLLKKADDRRTVRQAESLLQKSIKRDPTFLPSHLALAALQLYQQDCPEACLKTIDRALKWFPDDPELIQLQLDAKAVEQNLGYMVKAGSLAIPHLGDISMK